MIDGIQLTFTTRNPESHLLGLPCWEVLINENTGERVDNMKKAKLYGLHLQLKPSSYNGYHFIANGSLHKFHNYGEDNADQFTFPKLLESINRFVNTFAIDPDQTYLHGIEIGVNINLPFSPLRVLKNLVCYGVKPFTQINARSFTKGKQCSLKQYSVKVYDKAKTSEIDCGHVLRFEVAIDKMQAIEKYNVRTLADLQNIGKVRSLVNVLTDALGGIIWTDTTTDLSRLSDKELKQWLAFSNPLRWGQMEKRERYKAIRKWNLLLKKYGNLIDLFPHVLNTWESLFPSKMEAEKEGLTYRVLQNREAHKRETFLHLECSVIKSSICIEKLMLTDTTFLNNEVPHPATKQQPMNILKKRFCPSCGRDISTQGNRTVFCSEKLLGKVAKRCRNKSSNKRRDHKRKIQSAMKKNNYLLITYTDETGTAFSDVLHPSEISSSKEWLNRIQSVTALSFKQQITKPLSDAKVITKKVR